MEGDLLEEVPENGKGRCEVEMVSQPHPKTAYRYNKVYIKEVGGKRILRMVKGNSHTKILVYNAYKIVVAHNIAMAGTTRITHNEKVYNQPEYFNEEVG